MIASPDHSIRAGAAIPNPYTSRIPPRTLNCATSVTVATRVYPIASSCFTVSVSDPLPGPPFALPFPSSPSKTTRIDWRVAGTPVRSAVARAVVIRMRTSPDSRASSVSTRSPAISKCGSSAPSASRCG
jgi:hypothetical protein